MTCSAVSAAACRPDVQPPRKLSPACSERALTRPQVGSRSAPDSCLEQWAPRLRETAASARAGHPTRPGGRPSGRGQSRVSRTRPAAGGPAAGVSAPQTGREECSPGCSVLNSEEVCSLITETLTAAPDLEDSCLLREPSQSGGVSGSRWLRGRSSCRAAEDRLLRHPHPTGHEPKELVRSTTSIPKTREDEDLGGPQPSRLLETTTVSSPKVRGSSTRRHRGGRRDTGAVETRVSGDVGTCVTTLPP